MLSICATTNYNGSSDSSATTAAVPYSSKTGITLEPHTVMISPTQYPSPTIQVNTSVTLIATAPISAPVANDTSQTTSSSTTLGTSQNLQASTLTWTSVTSSCRSLTSTSIWSTSDAVQTYGSISGSSTSHQALLMPSSALPESNIFDGTYSPPVIVGIVIAGGFTSVLFIIIMFLLRKHIIRSRQSNAFRANGINWNPWTRDLQRLSMQQLRDSHPESFMWEEYYDRADDSSRVFHYNINSMAVYNPRLSDGLYNEQGYSETVEMRRERLDRLARRNHSPNGTIRNSISSWTGLIIPGFSIVPAVATSLRSIPTMRLPSILKRNSTSNNMHGMTRLVSSKQDNSVRGSAAKALKVLGWEESDVLVAKAKKEVRFGDTQVKEFGRTPFASATNSVAGDMKGGRKGV